ncbi:hypothetical protein ACHAQA_005544 [Verticillium albo-atrum]
MDQYSSKAQASVPPLGMINNLGTLSYTDPSSSTGTMPVKIEIQGNIDKGFFQSDCEWTCYRRNYFSCICSYSLSPYYPTQPLQYQHIGSKQSYTVFGFAMSISAVVSDNDSHTIELVQHTPKRDKGPIARPDKIRLLPKPPPAAHHPLGLYGHDAGGGGPSRVGYGESYSGGHSGGHSGGEGYQTEHTFERIQFKQATANNGKRRAAQQYYHLLVELWADVGAQATDKFVRIAYRKSAKMIVRGRSPGHYQGERRGSTSSGPGGSGGSMGGFSGGTIMPSEFPATGPTMGPGYNNTFEPRGGINNFGPPRHHHEMQYDAMIPPEDAKSIDTTKGYQYYPGAMYEGPQTDKNGIDMFAGHRNEPGVVSHMVPGVDSIHDRVKKDPEGDMLAGRFMPGPLAISNRCGTYEGKGASTGYYPAMLPPASTNIANIT